MRESSKHLSLSSRMAYSRKPQTARERVEDSACVWEWGDAGDIVEGRRQYNSICRGSEVICTGDIVLIHSASQGNPYIGKILHFHENLTDQQACASIEYLYWQNELMSALKKIPTRQRPKTPSFLENEVFFSDHQDTIELQNIAKITTVTLLEEHSDRQVSPGQLVARWRILLGKRKLVPVLNRSPTPRKVLADSVNTLSGNTLGRSLTTPIAHQQCPCSDLAPRITLTRTPTKSTNVYRDSGSPAAVSDPSITDVVTNFSPPTRTRHPPQDTKTPTKSPPLKTAPKASTFLEAVWRNKAANSPVSKIPRSCDSHTAPGRARSDASDCVGGESRHKKQRRLDTSAVTSLVTLSDSEEEGPVAMDTPPGDESEEDEEVLPTRRSLRGQQEPSAKETTSAGDRGSEAPGTVFDSNQTTNSPPHPISSRTRGGNLRRNIPSKSSPHTPSQKPVSTPSRPTPSQKSASTRPTRTPSQPTPTQKPTSSPSPHKDVYESDPLPDARLPHTPQARPTKRTPIKRRSLVAMRRPRKPDRPKAVSSHDSDNDSDYDNSETRADSDDNATPPKSPRLSARTNRSLSRKRTSSNSTSTPAKRHCPLARSAGRAGSKTPTKKGTPGRRSVATPCIPDRKKAGSKSKDQFEIAKQRLHVSAVPDSLPCREDEFASILSFVEGKLRDKTGGCMYISGVPGTGKTATVHEIMSCLQTAAEEGEIPRFKFVEVNGLRLTDPHQAYVSILKQLTGERATASHAADLLDKYFSSRERKGKMSTVLLVDELDLLWTRKQTVLYNLFDWPSQRNAGLIVLAVANTMDLPERIMKNKVSSRLGLTRLTFQPYTFQQLQEIVTSRTSGLKVFKPDALQLAARKVAAVSGDARRALDICRRATELAQQERGCGKGCGLVGMSHVDKAVQEMFSSTKVQAIKHASLHEKMFLRALLAELRRTGLEETTLKDVSAQLQALLRTEGMRPINHTQVAQVCCNLGACRLLLVQSSRVGVHRKIRLNVSQNDVIFALRDFIVT